MSKVKLIKIKSEIGAGTRGSRLGIDALEVAADKGGNDFFQRYDSIEVKGDYNAIFFNDFNNSIWAIGYEFGVCRAMY